VTSPVLDVGLLTTRIIELLGEHGLRVGDGVAPEAGGWATGSPNVAKFVAYTVVAFDGANPSLPGMVLPEAWEASVSLRHHGGSRAQVDFQATAARAVIEECRDVVVGPHKVVNITWRSLGGPTRYDQVDPPFWSSSDSVVLLCSD